MKTTALTIEVVTTYTWWFLPVMKTYCFVVNTLNLTPRKQTVDWLMGHGVIIETNDNG